MMYLDLWSQLDVNYDIIYASICLNKLPVKVRFLNQMWHNANIKRTFNGKVIWHIRKNPPFNLNGIFKYQPYLIDVDNYKIAGHYITKSHFVLCGPPCPIMLKKAYKIKPDMTLLLLCNMLKLKNNKKQIALKLLEAI